MALTVVTFGDSILDCGSYNAHGLHPAGLLAGNDDRIFPDFAGRDLSARDARLAPLIADALRNHGLADAAG
jgi:hypothetical protein